MKLADLLPTEKDQKRLHDIESTLLRRRTTGRLAGIVAAATASLQVARLVAEDGYVEKLRHVELDPASAAVLGAAFLAALVYFLLRRTGVLLRESKQPFRYTFGIETFAQVDKTPRDRVEAASWDRWALLHHDLSERLDQRIRRFSILSELRTEKSGALEAPRISDRRQSSHIHITGRYALRDDDDGKWLVHVMPEVRIGPPGTPATLAQPVRYVLDPREELPNETASPADARGRKHYELSVEDYRQVLERVYSSIATEVYAQLDRDVREKIALFPTSRLRAMALYREAEDFARSNTVDAYERAIALYRDAFRYFKLTGLGPLTRFLIRVRPFLWRGAVKYQHQWAHIVAGYARCLFYRRATSAQTGRRINPLYELPELLGEAIAATEKLHDRIGKRRTDGRAERTLAYFLYPPDSWINRWLLRSTFLFELQKNALFELYVVDAHVHCDLGNRAKALQRRDDASATAPDRVLSDPLYLVVQGRLEPVAARAILYFRQAVDLDPDFQIARWFLAQAREAAFRREEQMSLDRAEAAIEEYGQVATLNFGNIAALSAEGYIRWLARTAGARQRIDQGRQVKAIASEAFIGELNYRLARIAAEEGRFEECHRLYREAIGAEPALAAFEPGPESRVLTRDFDGIGLAMLRRFKDYKDQVERVIEAERKPRHRRPNRHPDRIPQPVPEAILNIVHAFVLNDYGNACLCYFHQRGDDSCLRRAINIYKKAAQMNPLDASPWFNLQNAYGWAGDPDDSIKECYERARQLAPTWTSVAIAAAKHRATTLFERLYREQREERPDDREIKRLEKEFTNARDKALEEIRQHTKLAPLLDGTAEQQVDRLVSIPWRKLDEQDIETMVHLAELLAHGDSSEELQATRLAGHLLELAPEDYRVTDVLLNLAKRLPRHDHTHKSGCVAENLALVRNQRQQIIDKWVETDPQNFLSIYWWRVNLEEQNCTSKFIDKYIWKQDESSQAQDVIIQGMEQIRTQFFSDGPDRFENLMGWVYFRRGKYAEAAAAFGRAVSMQPTTARYQFDLGQCREQMRDWEAARAAYCAARRLDSQAIEYAEGLASTLNQIGNQRWREDQFADAAANYQEAVSLAPEQAVYRRNLALAREHAKLPDEMTALSSAITEMRNAVEAAPHRSEYRDELLRLKTRLAALQCYRPTRRLNRSKGLARLAVWCGDDLAPFVWSGEEASVDLKERYSRLQRRIEQAYGIRVPEAHWGDHGLDEPERCLVEVRELTVWDGSVRGTKMLCPRCGDKLTPLSVDSDPEGDPPPGIDEAEWLDEKDWGAAKAAGRQLFDALDYVLLHVEGILVRRLHEFLTYEDLLQRLRDHRKTRIKAIAQSAEETNALRDMLKALLAERTPITEFDALCDVFLEAADRDSPAVVARMRMVPEVGRQLWGNSRAFTMLEIGPRFEQLIARGVMGAGKWPVLALEPLEHQLAMAAVRKGVQDIAQPALVVSSPILRPHVRRLIDGELPEIPVLAKEELLGEPRIDARRVIEFETRKPGRI